METSDGDMQKSISFNLPRFCNGRPDPDPEAGVESESDADDDGLDVADDSLVSSSNESPPRGGTADRNPQWILRLLCCLQVDSKPIPA